GTRRRTLSLSVLWQTAIPIGLGLALAAVACLVVSSGCAGTCGETDQNTVKVNAPVTVCHSPRVWRTARPPGAHGSN
ncbi:hypothetical protein, partial [Streptomyces sp. PAL114]|uniref:hypothetical protein n=1 Tax=Streptomyces sp. PAL114 TaxID=2970893 RepID=UPI0028FD8916